MENKIFLDKMKKLLKEDYDRFLLSYDEKPFKGIRVNTLKCTNERFLELFGSLEKAEFSENGFYLDSDYKGIGNSPLHHAGAFYVQEPSAMIAGTILDVKPGDKVLDLCAAPGGKSTQLASRLDGEGVLVANEYVASRAKILLSNIERMGIKNAIVTNNRPDVICEALEGYFDKVLVDAPCSGEGMFRKEPKALDEWSQNTVLDCAKRQALILESAKKAVKCGGELVYSTCTFSVEENEKQIDEFLKNNPEFELVDCGVEFGCSIPNGRIDGVTTDTEKMCRVFPFNKGEGHFAARLKRVSENDVCVGDNKQTPSTNKLFEEFWKACFTTPLPKTTSVVGDKVYILPKVMPPIKGLHTLRAGVFAGEIVKNRFVPAHSLFMSAKTDEVRQSVNLSLDSVNIKKYLYGMEIPCDSSIKGYVGVFVEGICVGFGKASNGVVKNHYPKGLRTLNI